MSKLALSQIIAVLAASTLMCDTVAMSTSEKMEMILSTKLSVYKLQKYVEEIRN